MTFVSSLIKKRALPIPHRNASTTRQVEVCKHSYWHNIYPFRPRGREKNKLLFDSGKRILDSSISVACGGIHHTTNSNRQMMGNRYHSLVHCLAALRCRSLAFDQRTTLKERSSTGRPFDAASWGVSSWCSYDNELQPFG